MPTTAIVGVGESQFYKRGKSPESELQLGLRAIRTAIADAGLVVADIDGLASFGNDQNAPGRVAAALGLRRLRSSTMVWGGGGGGVAAAVANASAAVAAGQANAVVVFRSLKQAARRFGQGSTGAPLGPHQRYTAPFGLMTPAQMFAMKVQRFLYEHQLSTAPLQAIARASYHHAQHNPDATMHRHPLDPETYETARWIVEPFRLYDCCLESDGAAAVVVTSAKRAVDSPHPVAYITATSQGMGPYASMEMCHNEPDYGSANFKEVADELFQRAGLTPSDISVVQAYENFTGGVLMALVEHGLVVPEQVEEEITFENLIWPHGRLPLNTSGGNLAHGYIHGMQLIVEAVRQIRGEARCQVESAEHALVIGGPMVAPVSSLILSRGRP